MILLILQTIFWEIPFMHALLIFNHNNHLLPPFLVNSFWHILPPTKFYCGLFLFRICLNLYFTCSYHVCSTLFRYRFSKPGHYNSYLFNSYFKLGKMSTQHLLFFIRTAMRQKPVTWYFSWVEWAFAKHKWSLIFSVYNAML